MLTAVTRFQTLASRKPTQGAGISSLTKDPMEDVVVTRLMTRAPGGGAG